MTAGSVYTTPFTLVTPDKQRIDVDPLVLAGTSKFFANVLASSSQIQTSTYNVDDLSSHVQLYLDAVKDGACPTDEQDWYTVFRLADKYDSVLAKSVLFSAIDVWLPANPEAAFAAAHLLGCSHLAAALSHRFTPSFQSQSSLFNQIPETEVELLILKERVRNEEKRQFLLDADIPSCLRPDACSSQPRGGLRHLWLGAIHKAMQAFSSQPLADPVKPVLSALVANAHDWPTCQLCVEGLDAAIEKMSKEWETRGKEQCQEGEEQGHEEEASARYPFSFREALYPHF